MDESTDRAIIKAEFSSGGAVKIPRDLVIPGRVSHSTAGPGAGYGSLVFSFDGMRTKKPISYDDSEFELIVDDKMSILRNGVSFIDDVKIEPIAFHCPEQAFFNLDQRCIFRCIYCNSPHLGSEYDKSNTPERMVELISRCKEPIEAISLTSGVVGSVENTVQMFVDAITKLKKYFPELPIGVEPYVDSHEQIDMLYSAGADEIKINCECAAKEIFDIACPDLDYDSIFDMLDYSVKIFGRGNVTSNIIIGLGETDDEVIELMESLMSKGILPGLRPLRISGMVRDEVRKKLPDANVPDPERIVRLAAHQKRLMIRYSMPETMRTMCFKCTCCDIVPFRDL